MAETGRFQEARIEEITSNDPRAIAIGPFGSALKSDQYTAIGVPVLRGQDITVGDELNRDGRVFVPEYVAAKFPACRVSKGDLVFPHRGAIGRVGIVGDEDWLMSSSMMKLSVDRERFDPKYVFYYFRGPGKRQLLERASTVGTPGIGQPLASLKSVVIRYPELKQQRAIAEVLGALDDKIAANSRLTDTSRSLAKAEWERAKNHNVEYVRLRDVATLNYGKSLPAKRRVAGGVQVVGSGGVTGTHNQALVAEAGIVVGRKGTAGAVHWLHGPHFPIDTTFFVTPTAGLTSHFLYYELTSMRLTEMNSDSAVPGLNREEAYAAPVRHPDQSSLRRFNEVVPVLFDLFAQVEAESLSLATTRDALLPLLMSGKVTVTDAETIVEEAL